MNLPTDVQSYKIKIRPESVVTAVLKRKDSVEKWALSPFRDGKSNGEKIADVKGVWLLFPMEKNVRFTAKT